MDIHDYHAWCIVPQPPRWAPVGRDSACVEDLVKIAHARSVLPARKWGRRVMSDPVPNHIR